MADAMWSSAAAGAGLEILFDSFLQLVKEVVKQNIMFKSSLKSLEETLTRLEPAIKKIDGFNKKLDRGDQVKDLLESMEKGKKLVIKCSKVHQCNFIVKPYYNGKLVKVIEDIKHFISTDMQVYQFLDQKETLYEMKQMGEKFKHLKFVATHGVGGLEGICSPPGLKEDPIGLEIPLKELKGKLLKDSDMASLIVIAGFAGSGKTTLAIALCHDEEVKENFKQNIFFVTVSKKPNLLVIVQRLFQHKGYGVPNFQSKEEAVNQLEYLLNQTGKECPILMVIDDVWPGSESIFDDLKFRIKNYKILVTSRYEFPSFGSTYKLHTLGEAESRTLFCQSAFLPEGNFYMPSLDLVNQIVKSCGGFPLVISVVGKSLRGKHAIGWEKKAKECSNAVAILTDAELLRRLQSSVEALDNSVKECFSDLGCFPEGQRIPATVLIDMWMERHNLSEYQAISNLHEIAERSLIDLVVIRKITSEVDTFYSEHFIKQHDLIRELAILQSYSGHIKKRERIFLEIIDNKLPDPWTQEDSKTIGAKLLSISTDITSSTKWFTIQALDVEVLVLNFQTKNYTLPVFMDKMHKLKVLVVTNYSFFPAELDNYSLLASLANLKRIRLERVLVPSLVQMKRLEKLSLFMCNVARAFNDKDLQLTASMLPNLMELYIDYCDDLVEIPAGFCGLVWLKKLIITNCHKVISIPQDIGKLVNLEVLNLNSCIELLALPDSIGGLQNLSILDISDCLSITKLPEQIGELQKLRKLCMVDCGSCKVPSSVRKLVHLRELISDEETAASWEIYKSYLPDLDIKVVKDVNLNWLFNH